MALNPAIQTRIEKIVNEELAKISQASRVSVSAFKVRADVEVTNGDQVYGNPVIGDSHLGEFSRDLDRGHATPRLVIDIAGGINGKTFGGTYSDTLWITGRSVSTPDHLTPAADHILRPAAKAIQDRLSVQSDILDALWAEHLRDFERRAEEKIAYLIQLTRNADRQLAVQIGAHLLESP